MPDYSAVMSRCLELASKGGGWVNPNPQVGCVVLSGAGEVLGEGWHEKYGEPHAEVNAINDALKRHGPDAVRNSTVFVSLEPCNHHGKTPPCSHLLVETGVRRVVIGARDPNGPASGGAEYLREHGIDVADGILAEEAYRLNEGFFRRVATGRPMVVLKIAQSIDGFVALKSGESKWITGEASRRRVHQLRSLYDIVLTGRGTAATDNPRLTVRHVEGRQPTRVVLDSNGALDPSLDLFADDHAASTIAVTTSGVNPSYKQQLERSGGRHWQSGSSEVDLNELLVRLGSEGGSEGSNANTVLVETGPALATALVKQDLVDRLLVFTAPVLFGDGIPALNDLGVTRVTDALSFSSHSIETVGEDVLFTGFLRDSVV